MAIPENYIDKITKDGESRDICPSADKVRVGNENFDGTNLDDVLNEIAEEMENAGYTPPAGGIPKTDLAPSVQQTLDDVANKVDKVNGKGLSTNDYTTEEKTKLGNLPTSDQLTQQLGGKANDNAVVKSITVNGQTQTPQNGNVNVVVPTVVLDDAPTAGSNNAVKSGGIKTAIDQVTPTIDANGYWVIGGQSTGQKAQGPAGNTQILDPTTFDPATQIINNVGDGGETDALSAEMGKVIRQNIMILLNALGTYAFPEGKPVLSWGSTVINYNINVNGVTGLTITNIEVNGVAVQSMPQKIEDGKSLSFTLTKGSSQIYRGVSISMGGTNITENTGVWDESTGEVTISNVTGDIVISASSLTLVEYLQSDGNQWIDTGIIAAANFKSEIKADILSPADSSWRRLLGTSDANQRFAIAVGLQSTSGNGKLYSQFGTSGNTFITASSSVVTGLHTFITQLTGSALSFSVDGVSGNAETTVVNQITLPSLSLFMFSCHREDSVVQSITAKVYYCKIWNGNDLVFDAVPVRVGQVGYMYDKVSDTLLGNIGTGSFTLGNDITE